MRKEEVEERKKKVSRVRGVYGKGVLQEEIERENYIKEAEKKKKKKKKKKTRGL